MDERVWAVQQVEDASTNVTKERSSCWDKELSQRSTQPPRPAGLPYKMHLPVPVFCRQVALTFLHLCSQVFESTTTIDIAILPKLDSSNYSHP
jgi:hypothetical protein